MYLLDAEHHAKVKLVFLRVTKENNPEALQFANVETEKPTH